MSLVTILYLFEKYFASKFVSNLKGLRWFLSEANIILAKFHYTFIAQFYEHRNLFLLWH